MGQFGAMSYLQHLDQTNSLKVKEKVNVIEAATALLGQEVEMANRYKIKNAETDQDLFYAVEQTDCFTRQLMQCCPDCAPWKLDFLLLAGGSNQLVMQMDKEWSATCCCLNRPMVAVTDVQSGQRLGTISDPCVCFNFKFNVYDGMGQDAFIADGGCCQPGLFCPLPCGPCAEVKFDLTNPEGQQIGQIVKKVPGCLKFLLAPDVDNYHVAFYPGAWVPETKALATALSIFMDFRFFSNNKSDDRGSGFDSFGGE